MPEVHTVLPAGHGQEGCELPELGWADSSDEHFDVVAVDQKVVCSDFLAREPG